MSYFLFKDFVFNEGISGFVGTDFGDFAESSVSAPNEVLLPCLAAPNDLGDPFGDAPVAGVLHNIFIIAYIYLGTMRVGGHQMMKMIKIQMFSFS